MILTNRRFLSCLAAVVAVGALSACGGKSSPTSAPTQATAAGTSTSSAPAAASGDAQGFCGVVRQQQATLQGTELSGLLTGGDATAWKAYLEKTTTMNQQLVDAAPAEIKASVASLQETTVALKTAMAAANYDVTKVGLTNLIKVLNSPERKQATTALVTYVKTNCDIDLTTTAK